MKNKDKEIAKLIGIPFALTTKGLKLQKKIWDCEGEVFKLILEMAKDLKEPKDGK